MTFRVTNLRRACASAAALLGIAAAACGAPTGDSVAPGMLALTLTDAAPASQMIARADIFVVRVDARPRTADTADAARGVSDDSASAGGWMTLAYPNRKVNVLAYQHGTAMPLGRSALPEGHYLGLRVVIDPAQSSVTLRDGRVLTGATTPGVAFPRGSRAGIVVVLYEPVHVETGRTTNLVLDFLVDRSFPVRGSALAPQGFFFTPVVHAAVTL